jgi:hypothetical protein
MHCVEMVGPQVSSPSTMWERKEDTELERSIVAEDTELERSIVAQLSRLSHDGSSLDYVAYAVHLITQKPIIVVKCN